MSGIKHLSEGIIEDLGLKWIRLLCAIILRTFLPNTSSRSIEFG